MSWSKRLTRLLYTTLLPSCSTSDGYACRNSWSCHEADSEEGRKADSAIGRALVMPLNLPQLQPRLQNLGPLTLPCPNPPPCLHLWPCCGPHPSHHFLLTGPPAHTHRHTDVDLASTPASLWSPFQSLSSFAGWLGLGLDPLYSLSCGLSQRISGGKSLTMHPSCKERLFEVFSLHQGGNPLAVENGHSQGQQKVGGRAHRCLGEEEVNSISVEKEMLVLMAAVPLPETASRGRKNVPVSCQRAEVNACLHVFSACSSGWLTF